MKPYHQENGITIYHGNSAEVLPTLEAPDVAFTSPPYLNLRDYGGQDLPPVDDVLTAVPKHKTTQMFVNYGALHKDQEVDLYWLDSAMNIRAAGWLFYSIYIWDKMNGRQGQACGRFRPAFEYILHMAAGVRDPQKSQRCVLSGIKRSGSSQRKPNGFIPQLSKPGLVSKFKTPDTVIRIFPENSSRERSQHPAIFPVALPTFFMLAWPGTYLDPFMGSGTTLVAAKRLGLEAVGIEIEEKYCEIAANRLAQNYFEFAN